MLAKANYELLREVAGHLKRAPQQFRSHRTQLRFCLRVTVAGLSAFAVARVLMVPLHGLWVVLTAVVVTEMSAGRSLRAVIQYMVGTLGGAVFAALVSVLAPHATVLAQGGVLALTIAPLALAASINPNFRVAPFSAVLVFLISGQLGQGPVESAVTRVFEVALGGVIALTVSLLVFPDRARDLGRHAAVQVLKQLASLTVQLFECFTHQPDPAEIARGQDNLSEAVTRYRALAEEAKNERLLSTRGEPDQAALSRTLLRLRNDLVMVGRAGTKPLPDVFAQRLGPRLTSFAAAASDFLLAGAAALARRSEPPALEAVDAALGAFTGEIGSLRREGLTRLLSSNEVEQVFALGFALEQLCRNFLDLQRCVHEYAGR